MARDDYFIIAYRILAYLYTCLKDGVQPDIGYISADSSAINISESYWEYIIRHLYEDGFVEGVSLINIAGMSTPGIKLKPSFMITPKGIDFLQNNSTMSKAKEFLKSLKEIIPGL